MKLLIRRDQRNGLLGKVVFAIDVRADLSAEEIANIRKYQLGDTLLYESHSIQGGSGLLGLASRAAINATVRVSITVKDLAGGKKVECKDVIEMLAIEEHIREAAKMFAEVLKAAKHFGGEEVLELA